MSSNIWNATEQKLEQVSGNVNINDSITSDDSTWSSEKINDSLVDLEKDYGKKEIADCNTVEETISYIAPSTLHSPKAEGLTNNARGILISAIREAPDDYCVQTAILNGSAQHFTRYKLPNNDWSDWQELATMDKVPNITKETTSSGITTFSLNGRIINNIFLGADGSNQYNIITYIYNSAVCIREIGGKTIPSNITFTKNGNNIYMKVPAYWLVYIS